MRARVVAIAVPAACALTLGACGSEGPPLPGPAASPPGAGAMVAAPEVPGDSDEFRQMEVPPGQLTRALPVGTAWAPDDGPTYGSLCLQCHAVSQTSFAVEDWRESLHARAGVTCSACHGSHEVGFVTQPGPDRCVLCHARQVEEMTASGHGPERAPGMRCVACHDPHATDRRIASTVTLCTGCHLDSDHVQEFHASRMGLVLAEDPVAPDGSPRAPDCVYCHQPASAILLETGDFRNDGATLHDPTVTVAAHANDANRLADETIEFLVPLCATCHSERNARYRLEHADPLLKHWTPIGMLDEVRRRPVPAAPAREVRP